ncbi:hypothetical protein [Cytobacillus sp. BC1816]
MNATFAIITSLGAWNDFILPLDQYIFHGQFSTDHNLTFASC